MSVELKQRVMEERDEPRARVVRGGGGGGEHNRECCPSLVVVVGCG